MKKPSVILAACFLFIVGCSSEIGAAGSETSGTIGQMVKAGFADGWSGKKNKTECIDQVRGESHFYAEVGKRNLSQALAYFEQRGYKKDGYVMQSIRAGFAGNPNKEQQDTLYCFLHDPFKQH